MMTFAILASAPMTLLALMFFYERNECAPLRAKAARLTVRNAARR